MRRDDKVIEIDLERDLIDGAVLKVYQRFRVALSAVVRTFQRGPGRADADLAARFLATNLTAQDEPPVPDLPVLTPRGGGYGFYFDVRQGDLGVALCCDAPVRGLYESGDIVTPQRATGHDYGCAVFLPGGRASSSLTPTDPPNAAGTATVQADDGSAALVLRGAGLTSPAELGSVVLAAAAPTAGVLLGSDAATTGVARLNDDVARNALMVTWMSQVTAALNTLAPGAVTPFAQPNIGTIASASTKVLSE